MRKLQIHATFWTMVIAIPFTVLALIGVAFLTENLIVISRAVGNFTQRLSVGGRGLWIEFSARWPEVAGMVIGMIVLLTIFLFVQNANKAEERKKTQ